MANGESCIHCGKNETQHEDPECMHETCDQGSQSSVKHHPDCVGAVAGQDIMCDGDCEATIQKVADEEEYWKYYVNGASVYMYILQLHLGAHPSQLTPLGPD